MGRPMIINIFFFKKNYCTIQDSKIRNTKHNDDGKGEKRSSNKIGNIQKGNKIYI